MVTFVAISPGNYRIVEGQLQVGWLRRHIAGGWVVYRTMSGNVIGHRHYFKNAKTLARETNWEVYDA